MQSWTSTSYFSNSHQLISNYIGLGRNNPYTGSLEKGLQVIQQGNQCMGWFALPNYIAVNSPRSLFSWILVKTGVAQTTLHQHNSRSPPPSLFTWDNVILTTSHYTLMQLIFSSLPLKKNETYRGRRKGRKRNDHVQAYVSFIQHKKPWNGILLGGSYC